MSLIGYERSAPLANEALATGRMMQELIINDPDLTNDLIGKVLGDDAFMRPNRIRR